jgi:2,5-diamino-6-(ribosylamino)-4(3H)-pyrimidinone 5'-phosphate reductase
VSPPQRPEIWINCAVSVDGRLAYAGGKPAKLSGPEDLARVHRMRAEADAILVGVGTVVADDPSLLVKWELAGRPAGPAPTRIVLDPRGRTPERARVLDGSAPTLIATSEQNQRRFAPPVETLVAGRETVELDRLGPALLARGLRRVMVEGGGTVIASFLRARAFDRLTVYVAPVVIGGRHAPSLALGAECEDARGTVPLALESGGPLGPGYLLTFRPAAPARA